MKHYGKMAKIDKVCVVYGGFYPRSRKVFGCGRGGTAGRLFYWQARTPAVDADVDPPKRKRPPFISLCSLCFLWLKLLCELRELCVRFIGGLPTRSGFRLRQFVIYASGVSVRLRELRNSAPVGRSITAFHFFREHCQFAYPMTFIHS